jgi:hypothetical protein
MIMIFIEDEWLWHQLVTAEPHEQMVQFSHCSHLGAAILLGQI